MKSFTIAVGLLVATQAMQVTWEEEEDVVVCLDGPVACELDEDGNDAFCAEDEGCFIMADFGSKCVDLEVAQCSTICPDDMVLDPLRWCECISRE